MGKCVKSLGLHSDLTIETIEKQVTVFLRRLHPMLKATDSMLDLDIQKIIKEFCSQPQLYQDIPDILHSILVSAVKGSVESVTESMASKIKYFNAPDRKLKLSTLNQEVFISWNRPDLCNADSVIKASLDRHFGGKWHFVTPSSLKFYQVSKAVDSLKNNCPKFSFM